MPRIMRWLVVATLLAAAVAAQGLWWIRGMPVAIVDAPPGKIGCVSYAPYLTGQSPFDELLVLPRRQTEADLRALSDRVATRKRGGEGRRGACRGNTGGR